MTPIWIALTCLATTMAQAETGSLFPSTNPPPVATRSSLVTLDRTAGLFAPLPPRATAARPSTGQAARLLDLIAQAEAGSAGYDAVQHGARVRPDRRPTDMTLGEIYAWIDATPGQPHAIGRYQFIPNTLRHVAHTQGFDATTRFSPATQDTLAMVLLRDAGWEAFQDGTLPRRDFMHALARIWAGLPLPTGRSYYHGYAGNAASMTWARFDQGMADIWPDQP